MREDTHAAHLNRQKRPHRRLHKRQDTKAQTILVFFPQKDLGVVSRALDFLLLLIGREPASRRVAARGQALEEATLTTAILRRRDDTRTIIDRGVVIVMVDFVLRHEPGSGPHDVIARTVAGANIFGVDDFFAETAWFFAGGTEGNDLETHCGEYQECVSILCADGNLAAFLASAVRGRGDDRWLFGES